MFIVDSYFEIFAAAVFLAAFGVLAFRKAEFGVYLAAFFLPLYVFKFSVFGLPLNLFEAAVYFLFLIWFSRTDFERIKTLFGEIKSNKLFNAGLILFFGGALISTVLSPDLKTSAGILKSWFFAPFLFFLAAKAEITAKEKIKNVLRAAALSGATVSFISLFYFFSGRLTFDGRLAAFYLSPNHLAMFLAPILPLVFYLFFAAEKKAEKIASAAVIFSISAVIFLTYSYGAWLAVAAASAFAALFSRISAKKKVVLFSALVFLFLLLIFSQIGAKKFQSVFSERSSLASRLAIWRTAFDLLKDYPIFGVGPGMFQKFYLDYQKYYPPYLEWAVPQPHNLYLAFWLQTGIAGLAGFVLLAVSFFKTKIAALRKNGDWFRSADFWLVLAFAIVLIHGLIDTPYFKNDLSALFWLILAI